LRPVAFFFRVRDAVAIRRRLLTTHSRNVHHGVPTIERRS
jgi:hypothetical protein